MRIAVVLVLSVMACGRGTGTTPASVPQLDEEPAKTQDPPASLPGIDAMTFLTKESFRPAMPPNAPAGLLDKVKFESIRLLDPEIRTRVNPDLLREFLEHHLGDGRALRAFESWEHGMGASVGDGR